MTCHKYYTSCFSNAFRLTHAEYISLEIQSKKKLWQQFIDLNFKDTANDVTPDNDLFLNGEYIFSFPFHKYV